MKPFIAALIALGALTAGAFGVVENVDFSSGAAYSSDSTRLD